MGNSPWGHKELDTTERLHFHFPFLQQTRDKGKMWTLFVSETAIWEVKESDPETTIQCSLLHAL